MSCIDCANTALEYRRGPLCAYHGLVTDDGAPDAKQALAMMINPTAFEKIAASHAYFTLNSPARGRKFGPWEERDVQEAYAAAGRVAMLYGWPT